MRPLLDPVKKNDLITKILDDIEKMREAFACDERFAGEMNYIDQNDRMRTIAMEDDEEGPLPVGLIFKVDGRGLVVAERWPDGREAEANRQRAKLGTNDEIPF
jgi:hypothetical protein